MALLPYRPSIDGLRSIAVLSVCVFHLVRGWLPGGFAGVDVFFVISGYLITSIILKEIDAGTFSFGKFYQRRIARLFPAYFTMAIATMAGAVFVYSDQLIAALGWMLAATSLSAANFKLLLQGNYFTIPADSQPLLHCWSLAVEEQFYLVFPLILVGLNQWFLRTPATSWVRNHRGWLLVSAMAASFAVCVALTYGGYPTVAFYMLPARAWELLAGASVSYAAIYHRDWNAKLWGRLADLGLAIVVLSLLLLREGDHFPGYVAVFPVLGTALCIGPLLAGTDNLGNRLLSWQPMVYVGQRAYSIYLWHWPVFALVDYQWYESAPGFRLALKVVLTTALSLACYRFIEHPFRGFLNQPNRRQTAFAFLFLMICICVPGGTVFRKHYYIEATLSDVQQGGLVYNHESRRGTIVLLGDSQGSMYGKAVLDAATGLGMKLIEAAVVAGDPLPNPAPAPSPELWSASLDLVRKAQPDYVVMACEWRKHMLHDRTRAALAVKELAASAKYVILITKPPALPNEATREAIRQGIHPPFIEPTEQRRERLETNAAVQALAGGNVIVIDIDPMFTNPDGSVRFAAPGGEEYYFDLTHLSGAGARLVMDPLIAAIRSHPPL